MGVKLREQWKLDTRTGKKISKGWYVMIDWNGKRKAKSFGKNKALAKDFATTIEAKLKLGTIGVENKTGVAFEDYAKTWLERIKHTRKYSTYFGYQKMLVRDLLPFLKGLDLTDITREKVKALAYARLEGGHSPKTVQNLLRGLSSLLGHAVEDDLLTVNPALKPGKFLPQVSKRRSVNPFTRQEVATFLEAVQSHAPRYHAFFLCAVRTGMRLGELIALQWGDIDFHGRFIEVQRNCALGRIGTPKSGESRRVDMSLELTHSLRNLQTERQLEATVNGWHETPAWVFSNEVGGHLDPDNVRKRVFYKVLKKAGIRHLRFHDLRHTFASLLLQQGESPVYVKEQMGHSSIQVTVDLYGHLIRGGNIQAVDRLDGPVEKSPEIGQSATQPQPHQFVPIKKPYWNGQQDLQDQHLMLVAGARKHRQR